MEVGLKKIGTTRRQFLKTAGSLYLLGLAHPLLTSCGSGQRTPAYSRTIGQTTAYINELMTKNNVQGLAIGLVDDQEVVWAQGFGYADADPAKKVPVTNETLFGIGSTSKTFAAMMIMKLVEQGLVNLDDPLVKYIPQFSLGAPLDPAAPPSGPITIRTMLTQHSGVPGELVGPSSIFTSVFHPDYNARAIDYLKSSQAQYPTDYFFAYCNTAVGFLAEVIAAATGRSFMDYSNEFLRSLGMNHSSFDRDDPSVAVGQTKTYMRAGTEVFDGYVNPLTAGSMLSSVADMTRYIKMIHAGGKAGSARVLRSDTLEAMVTPQNMSVPLDFDFRIGFMWWLADPDLAYAGRLCHHGGDTNLSHTQLEILLDHKLGVIVLTNTSSGGAIKNDVAIKALQLAVEEKVALRPPAFVPVYSAVVSWSPEQLDALAGIYISVFPEGGSALPALYVGALPASQYDRITRAGSSLTWTRNAGSDSPVTKTLVPRENGRFSAPDSQEIEYGFETVSGRKVMVAYSRGFRSLCADRYDPVVIPAPVWKAWAARVGTYRIIDLDPDEITRTYPNIPAEFNDLKLRVKDGLLLFGKAMEGQIPLAPVSDSDVLAYRPGLARNLGEVVKIVTVNGEELIDYSGCRYRKA